MLIRFNSGKVGFFVFQFQSHLEEVPYIDALEPAMALAPVRPRSRMPRRNWPPTCVSLLCGFWRETLIIGRKKLNMNCLQHLCSTRLILRRMIAVHESCAVFTDNAQEGCVSQRKAVLVCKRRHEMWIPCKICSCGGRVFMKWKLLVFLTIQEIWSF